MSNPLNLDAPILEGIARAYLPSRWHYYYSRNKLATDPLYGGVARALNGTSAPVLDLGCGIGLLAHYLRACGFQVPYRGVDNDTAKIALARTVAARTGLSHASFAAMDVGQGIPDHSGSITVLDVLQFLPPDRLGEFVGKLADCVSPGGRLVIRTGLEDASWRTRVTRTADVLARAIRWMNAAPRAYPTRELLVSVLESRGLEAEFSPLWGNTPFNNWLLVGRRR